MTHTSGGDSWYTLDAKFRGSNVIYRFWWMLV